VRGHWQWKKGAPLSNVLMPVSFSASGVFLNSVLERSLDKEETNQGSPVFTLCFICQRFPANDVLLLVVHDFDAMRVQGLLEL
jgi:hypothetical protein